MIIIEKIQKKIQNFIIFFNYLINKTFGLTNVNYNEYTFIDDNSENTNNIEIDNNKNNNNEQYCNLYTIFQNIIFRK